MFTIENLKVSKVFDVLSPLGINSIPRNESLDNYSIGIDLYFPALSPEFLKALGNSNKFLSSNKKYTEFINEFNNNVKKDGALATGYFETNGFKICIKEYYNGYIEISDIKKIQIPTGICLDLPNNVWAEIRTKSSNFKNNWTEIHGTIDMNYTYGMGVQLVKLDKNEPVKLEVDQKFTQLVLHEAVPILNIEVIPINKWEDIETIQRKRNIRTGGFGSTGKF